MKTVSVIIPTFNRAKMVLRAVSSVLYQTFDDYEIVVVDDASTDDTISRLKSYFKNIRIISLKGNSGVAVARNTGIMATNSPYIAFLDSDDYWFSRKLAKQVDFFKENPGACICQTDEIWIRNGRRVNPKKRHKKPSGDIYKQSLPLCVVSPSAVMIKRDVFKDVGMFDENLPVCEDYDLWLRISSRYYVYLIEDPLVVKTGGHGDQLSRSLSGMDRYRIYSLVKIMRIGVLSEDQMRSTMNELKRKCTIYGNGCIKRGRLKEGQYYLTLPEKMESLVLERP